MQRRQLAELGVITPVGRVILPVGLWVNQALILALMAHGDVAED